MLPWWFYLGAFMFYTYMFYTRTDLGNYYIRICWFYISILLHGIECMFTMIPSYLRGDGADLIFHTFRYWCMWSGIAVEVRGFEEYLEDNYEPAVIVVNHQSSIDVVGMSHVWPHRCVVMMKRSLNFVPFFNIASYLANCIFVDRYNKDKAMAAIDHAVSQLKSKNHKLWVFPEGTRNPSGGMLPFKKGAFIIAVRAQIPVIPIVFSDYRSFYSKKDKFFDNDGYIIAEVLPPIETTGMTLDDVDKLTEDTRQAMLEVYKANSYQATFTTEALRDGLYTRIRDRYVPEYK